MLVPWRVNLSVFKSCFPVVCSIWTSSSVSIDVYPSLWPLRDLRAELSPSCNTFFNRKSQAGRPSCHLEVAKKTLWQNLAFSGGWATFVWNGVLKKTQTNPRLRIWDPTLLTAWILFEENHVASLCIYNCIYTPSQQQGHWRFLGILWCSLLLMNRIHFITQRSSLCWSSPPGMEQ